MLLELYWTYQNISLALRLSSIKLGWTPLARRRRFHRCVAICKYLNNLISSDLSLIRNSDIHRCNTRRCHDLHLPLKHRFVYHAVSDWNNLHLQIRQLSRSNNF